MDTELNDSLSFLQSNIRFGLLTIQRVLALLSDVMDDSTFET
jgi:hypothetical protein